ncbi:MAG: AAA family ATPase [Nitrosomonas sp.]|nr:AAA family ATPase [Nitrosomonas sp.]
MFNAIPASPNAQAAYDELIKEIDHKEIINLVNGSDIKIEAINWLWQGWLATGKIHILGGAPGTGKTTLAMKIAATISIGGTWPDESKAEIGSVVIWSGEDDISDTLTPRLVAAGANLANIYFIKDVGKGLKQRFFDPAKDMDALKSKLSHIKNVRLLIVDPIVSAISGDSHKNAEVRRGLMPLEDLARSMRCAVLGITHFSKGTGGREPIERINGSLAFGAVARVVMVTVKQQQEDESGRNTRLLLRAKSNIGADTGGFEYDIVQDELTSHSDVTVTRTVWGKVIEGAARDLLAKAEAFDNDNEEGSLADAKRFLIDLLADGAVASKQVRIDANSAGIAWQTVRRAKNALKVKATKIGMEGGWVWSLPDNIQT